VKKEFFVCDICGVEVGTANEREKFQISFWADRVADAAGGMENEYRTADLCPKHLIQLLTKIDQCITVEGNPNKYIVGKFEDANRHRSTGVMATLLDGFLRTRKKG
jgi:hypothetical protein